MKIKKHSLGFTIVELLVVISIIALLIGILVPAVQKARDSAKVTQSKSNIHQVMVALQTYASDHNDRNFTTAPDNLSSGDRRGMDIAAAINDLNAIGDAFGMGVRLGNVGADAGGTIYSIRDASLLWLRNRRHRTILFSIWSNYKLKRNARLRCLAISKRHASCRVHGWRYAS